MWDWLAKYRPDQPRVPKGDPAGGQWTGGVAGATGYAATIASTDGLDIGSEGARQLGMSAVSFPMPGISIYTTPGDYPGAYVARLHGGPGYERRSAPSIEVAGTEAAAVKGVLDALPKEHRERLAEMRTRVMFVEAPHTALERDAAISGAVLADPSRRPGAGDDLPTPMFISERGIREAIDVLSDVGTRVGYDEERDSIVLHETGHVIDYALGVSTGAKKGVSATGAAMLSLTRLGVNLVRAVNNDVLAAPGGVREARGVLPSPMTSRFAAHYNMSAMGIDYAVAELFADSYAYLMGAPTIRTTPAVEFAIRFPRSIAAVQRILHKRGLPTVRRGYRIVGGKPRLVFDRSVTSTGEEQVVEVEKGYNPNQPRHPKGDPRGGKFAPKGGGGIVATPSTEKKPVKTKVKPKDKELAQRPRGVGGNFNREEWEKLSIPDRKKAFLALSEAEQDLLANAATTVKRAVAGVGTLAGAWGKGEFSADVATRVKALVAQGGVHQDTAAMIQRAAVQFHATLAEARAPAPAARKLAEAWFDHMAAQEMETLSRSLGDHGARHLLQDNDFAKRILDAVPGNQERSAVTRAVIMMGAAFHDTGYLTPPSQAFMDEGHPRWSAQHFQRNVRGLVRDALGEGAARDTQHLILTHSDTNVDWEKDAVGSAFRTADNLGLFQQEKLPGMVRYVPKNRAVLEDLYHKRVTPEAARITMTKNIADMPSLHPGIKQRLTRAVLESGPILPKLTLGMYGGRVESFGWEQNHLSVKLYAAPKHAAVIERYADLGQAQFTKLFKTYKSDQGIAAAFDAGGWTFAQGGKNLITFKAGRAIGKLWRWLRAS